MKLPEIVFSHLTQVVMMEYGAMAKITVILEHVHVTKNWQNSKQLECQEFPL
jgi:hypothetical protein